MWKTQKSVSKSTTFRPIHHRCHSSFGTMFGFRIVHCCSKPHSDLSDGDSAFRVTQHLVKSNNSPCNTCGSTTMSHGGFLSYPRENSSASCTYTHVIEGRKLVTILLPASGDQELCTSQIQELHSVPMSRTRRTVPGYSLWLEPGDTLYV
jgi:hypothetical protein